MRLQELKIQTNLIKKRKLKDWKKDTLLEI